MQIRPRAFGLISSMPSALARRWVMGSAAIAAVGYATMSVVILLNRRAGGTHVFANTVPTALLCTVALVLAWRGRVQPAGVLLVLTVWAQTQLGYLVTVSVPMPGLMLTPVVVVGSALLLGVRWAGVLAVVSVILSVPMTLASPAVRGIGLTPNGAYWLALHGIIVLVAWGLISLALTTLGRTLALSRAQQEDLRETIRVAPDGILVVRHDDRVAIANPAAGRLLGLSPDLCEGQQLSALFDAADVTTPAPLEALERAVPDQRIVWKTTRASGEALHFEVEWRPMAGGRRQIVLHDTSERERTEAARRAMELQLAHAQRLESIGLLAAGIAHDFNNILTVVGGCGEILRRGPSPVAPSLVEEILSAKDRGSALTRQLLSFARRDVAQPVVLDLSAHIGGLSRFLQRVAGEQVRIVLRLVPDCMVCIDVGQFEQVLVNLVSNARDAMPAGGECTIVVDHATDESDARRVRLSVTDTGVGMDAATTERVFDPFFTTKTRGRGTGLGLAVLHGIVTKSGGTVAVTSEPGRGTSFTLEFPEAVGGVPAEVPAAVVESRLRESATILVVEDDDGTRAVAGRMLESLGYDVLLAANGTEALELAEQHGEAIDLLLTDVMMPGMSGPEVAVRITQRIPEVPVLYMSGYTGDALASVAGLQLETDLLPKPFGVDELARLTSSKLALGRRPSR